jgi:riboflavin transporter FmnP
MKQSFARTLIIVSLFLSSMSFILSLIAFYLPNWKYIQRRSSIISSDMDPLIRGEAEKYNDLLYRRGSFYLN